MSRFSFKIFLTHSNFNYTIEMHVWVTYFIKWYTQLRILVKIRYCAKYERLCRYCENIRKIDSECRMRSNIKDVFIIKR